MGYKVAIPAAFTAAFVMALAPAVGQNRTARPGAEPDAGLQLAALMRANGSDTPTGAAAQAAFIEEYCSACHNDVDKVGGLDLTSLSTADMGPHSEIWEKVARKVRGGMMPPAQAYRPDRNNAVLFATSVEQSLDRYAVTNPNPGASVVQRLNRNEYSNAIRDILGLNLDVTAMLPPDDSSHGFDNMSEMLGVSPSLIEGYLSAAMRISRQAVGDLEMEPVTARLTPPAGSNQNARVDGLPLGTRGGMTAEYYFPLDGDYQVTIAAAGVGGGGPGGGGGLNVATTRPSSGPAARLAVLVDGKPIDVQNPARFTLTMKAGPANISAALIDLSRGNGLDSVYAANGNLGGLTGITIVGPTNITGRGDTPIRQRLFVCHPTSQADETSCAKKIFAQLATRAYRQPVSEDDTAVLEPLMTAYAQGRALGDFDVGIQYGLARALVDPRFLFRIESEPARVAAGKPYKITDVELASRLSFFLWSSVPDDELLQVAAAGRLSRPAELERQVRRMLDSPKAEALVDNFAGQWLRLREVDTVEPQDPEFDNALRNAMRDETKMFFRSIMREDRNIVTLLDADYTFLNERLARHYGIEGVTGPEMRRVTLPADSIRRGLLGQASILTVTSTADRTSPVVRGSWVLQNILGLPVPLPPPGVETNLNQTPEQIAALGLLPLRERLEHHRDNPACRDCHAAMDPIGFSLEPFDKVGRFRTEDSGHPINASGTLVDGQVLDGPASLRAALVKDKDVYVVSFTEKLLTYALGRPVAYYDEPAVRTVVRNAAQNDYKFSSIVLNIVNSAPFQQRVKSSSMAVASAQ